MLPQINNKISRFVYTQKLSRLVNEFLINCCFCMLFIVDKKCSLLCFCLLFELGKEIWLNEETIFDSWKKKKHKKQTLNPTWTNQLFLKATPIASKQFIICICRFLEVFQRSSDWIDFYSVIRVLWKISWYPEFPLVLFLFRSNCITICPNFLKSIRRTNFERIDAVSITHAIYRWNRQRLSIRHFVDNCTMCAYDYTRCSVFLFIGFHPSNLNAVLIHFSLSLSFPLPLLVPFLSSFISYVA